MKTNITLLLVVLFTQLSYSQSDTLLVRHIHKTTYDYISYVVRGSVLFAVTDSGKLLIWNLDKYDTIYFPHNSTDKKFTAIAKDRKDNIILGTNTGDIFKLNPENLSLTLLMHAKYYVKSICFNTDNKMYMVVAYAVYDPVNNKYWTKFKNHTDGLTHFRTVLGVYKKRTKTYFNYPGFTYLDRKDRWWMFSDYGEWGGDVQIFDTKNARIYNNKFDSLSDLSPQSAFEDIEGNMYITSGLQHFMITGKIYKITPDRSVSLIYNGAASRIVRDSTTHVELDAAHNPVVISARTYTVDESKLVGPGTYNAKDNCIYFSTNYGFYKAELRKNAASIDPEFLFEPRLSWNREQAAIGVSMTVKKIEFFADSKLLFLTENNGFGIYDKNRLVMFQ